MADRFPQALDLEADALRALSEPLRGVAGQLSGTHCPEHWRQMLRGQRTLPLYDLCRLATQPTKEPRKAALGVLSVLALALEHAVVPLQSPGGCIVSSAIRTAEIATATLGDVTRAVADGQVDQDEAKLLRAHALRLRAAAGAFEAAAHGTGGA